MLVGMFFGSLAAWAHLCDDVFMQAKDNLAVKVDVRDGQLRIGKSASFRVYLLNTMDRDIVDIRLEALSNEFKTTVTPSPNWGGFPYLKAKRTGGKKEYFTVRLDRNPGLPDGKYVIKLRLYNGQRKSQSFKTVDLDSAASICAMPKAAKVSVDGKAEEKEWKDAYLCSSFYEYKRTGPYYENRPAKHQTRVRVAADANYLYCLFMMQSDTQAKQVKSDCAEIFVAPNSNATPVKITIDRISGKVEVKKPPKEDKAKADKAKKKTENVEVKVDKDKGVIECRIPRALAEIDKTQSFYANFTRTTTTGNKEVVSYWRGNSYSTMDPIVYGVFTPAKTETKAK